MLDIDRWMPILGLCGFWSLCSAGTLIESHDGNGATVTMRIGEHRARIDSGAPQAYMVMDLDSGQVLMVSPPQRMVILIAGGGGEEGAGAGDIALQVLEQGPGDTVAGYATRRYRIMAEGRQCFDDHLSRELLELPGMHRLAEVLAGAGGEPGPGAAPCEQAALAMGRRYASLGVPLKTVGADGRVSHEIIRIERDRDFPDDIFVVPPDYQRVDQQALMDQAAAAVRGLAHRDDGTGTTAHRDEGGGGHLSAPAGADPPEDDRIAAPATALNGQE